MDDLTTASMGTVVSGDTVQVLQQQQHHELQTQPKGELVHSQQELVNLSEHMHVIREIVSIPKEVILITLVSQEPALYNPKHELYRNTVQKDQKWMQISDSVGWPGQLKMLFLCTKSIWETHFQFFFSCFAFRISVQGQMESYA